MEILMKCASDIIEMPNLSVRRFTGKMYILVAEEHESRTLR